MRDTCDEIFRKQYIQLMTLFIPLRHDSHDRYYLNLFRIITILYHLYIYYEIDHMAYNIIINRLTENMFIEGTMRKWHDDDTFRIIKRK